MMILLYLAVEVSCEYYCTYLNETLHTYFTYKKLVGERMNFNLDEN